MNEGIILEASGRVDDAIESSTRSAGAGYGFHDLNALDDRAIFIEVLFTRCDIASFAVVKSRFDI
jgi:hypothetical protein